MRIGLGVGVGGCGLVWAYMGKGGQRWADQDSQTDWVGVSDVPNGWVWVCVLV